jgi:two-component system response regulator HydG
LDLGRNSAHHIGAHSPRMRAILSMAERVAQVDTTVLVTGESGVGKERLAQYIHATSERARAKFIAINCGALTPTLLESELFGHKRGAFTGALADHPGLFEAADRGTVFLDEIGELPLEMQASLLRVLQEREVRRVGDTQVRSVDVRIIAATNRDLETDVSEHRFRQDLYYRLSVFVVRIPPLRERPDDLRALAHAILLERARHLRRPIEGYTPRALRRILQYPWPGNVRELQNAIEHACVLAKGAEIDLDDLPPAIRDRHAVPLGGRPIRPLKEIEREHILAAMSQTGGNRRLAAAQLKIGIATLQRRLRQYRCDE